MKKSVVPSKMCIRDSYCREIEESGIDRVQILSPVRAEGAASAEQLNEAIREVVNPFRSAEDEIKIGVKVFRVNDRIMPVSYTHLYLPQ